MATKEEEQNPVSDEPQITEKQWYRFAVCGLIFTIVAGLAALAWVFCAQTIREMTTRVQIVSPFIVAVGAITTFCTVAWRGLVASSQADEQRRQNQANEFVNYAKLLQEGAKMLGETDRDPHVMAGIATLDIVVADPQRRFGVQAMDLLAQFVQTHYGAEELNDLTRSALQVLANGEERGIFSRLNGKFKRSDGKHWINIRGFKTIRYVGGRMRNEPYKKALERAQVTTFEDVHFHYCEIYQDFTYVRCFFQSCKIKTISVDDFADCAFKTCDFSGTFVDDPAGDLARTINSEDLKALRTGGNFYDIDNPPVVDGDTFNWSTVLFPKIPEEDI